jgi:proteasome lid subunit RPN8/RPN11
MSQIPLYIKTDHEMPRPKDSEFYLLTRDGVYLCRNHAFFQTDVRAARLPHWLLPHHEKCQSRFPKLPVAALEFIVGFFHEAYVLHGSEAIVLLFWDTVRKRYRIYVPEQEATVWESSSGLRSAMDVAYKVPTTFPAGCILAASIHSHADGDAYSSWTDRRDELFRDGVHIVCGRIDRDRPSFHLELAVDNQRFPLEFHEFFQGYQRRRRIIPKQWLSRLTCRVNRPRPAWQTNRSSR